MILDQMAPGQRFRFAADLRRRGPWELLDKGPGSALIEFKGPNPGVKRTFQARDRKGQVVTRTVTDYEETIERCALGADVEPLEGGTHAEG